MSENRSVDVNGGREIRRSEKVQPQQSMNEHRTEERRIFMECRQNSETGAGHVRGTMQAGK